VDMLARARALWQVRENRFWSAAAQGVTEPVGWVPRPRSPLPVDAFRAELLQVVQTHRVVVVSGATGCGKSTRIPQFILEALPESSTVTCEPRRIAAISLAKRVADELGEEVGQTCGFAVRLESVMSRATRLLYCTSGVLLRRLAWDRELRGTTHVVLDEAHERSMLSDLVLLALKNLVHGARPDLRVVVLSATMDPRLFADYFAVPDAYVVEIPNAVKHVIHTRFLEDALVETGYTNDDDDDDDDNGGGAPGAGGFSLEGLDDLPFTVTDVLTRMTPGELQVGLIAALVARIARGLEVVPGAEANTAVLVFVSGLMPMTVLLEHLEDALKPRDGFVLLPLHSQLSIEEQSLVFARAPKGVTKVVVATNIAETSVTIEDVGYVIDTCMVKESAYEYVSRLPSLDERFVSKASAMQRRGRCGRTAPGVCWHLVTRPFFNAELREYAEPESTRCNLEESMLHVKLLHAAGLDEASNALDFFNALPSPPDEEHVKQTMTDLLDMGALVKLASSPDGTILSALGLHLAALPCELRIGKMLLMGCVFSLVDPLLTAASSLGSRSAFSAPFDKRRAAHAKLTRLRFSKSSDAIAAVKVRDAWLKARRAGKEHEFQASTMVSLAALTRNEREREVLAKSLQRAGMLDAAADWRSAVRAASTRAGDTAMLRAMLCAGHFPNVAKVLPTGAVVCGPCAFGSSEPLPCSIGALSVLSNKTAKLTWLVYGDRLLSRTSQRLALRDVTACPPMALLCFGDVFIVDRAKKSRDGLVSMRVGRWIVVRAKPKVAHLIAGVRRKLDDFLTDVWVSGLLERLQRSEVCELVSKICHTSDGVQQWEDDLV